MATYNPPIMPRPPKQPTLLNHTRYKLEVAYYRYSINTGLYVMSPGEKLAFNMIVLSALSLFLWALWICTIWWCVPCSALMGRMRRHVLGPVLSIFLPTFDLRIFGEKLTAEFFERLLGQMSGLEGGKGSLQYSGEAAASLQEFWRQGNTTTGLL